MPDPGKRSDTLTGTMAKETDHAFVAVGKIVRPHGIKGELKVRPTTDDPNRFHLLDVVNLRFPGKDEMESAIVKSARVQPDAVIIRLQDVPDRTVAERYRNAEIMIRREHCLTLEEGRYYIFDLVGLNAVDTDGNALGKLTDVLEYPAHDVYVIRNADTELMVPAVSTFIQNIDTENGTITIRLIDGLQAI